MRSETRPSAATVAFLLAAVGFIVFSRAAWNGFITLDDPSYILENPHVRAGLTAEGIRWAFTSSFEGNWDPLTWISHMIDVELFGLHPAGHHLVGALVHVANAVLLLLLFHRTTASLGRSAFVAALFLLHPLHVEPVAWAAERKELLCALFSILTLHAYAVWARRGGRAAYAAALLLFALALLSKPMAVTLPFVLILFDLWPLGRLAFDDRRGLLRRVAEKTPFFALAAAASAIAWWAQSAAGALPDLPFRIRAGNAMLGYVGYLRKTLWPSGLSVYYPHPGSDLPAATAVAAAALIVALTVLSAWAARRRAYVATGWLWYLGTLVPVIGFVQFGGHAMADRFAYFPLVGLFVIASWGGLELLRSVAEGERVAATAAAWILVGATAATWVQLGYWRDDLTLFGHAVAVDDRNWIAQNTLGGLLGASGRVGEAIPHFEKAIEAFPEYAEAHFNLAVALYRSGVPDEAIPQYREAIRIEPGNVDRRVALAGVLEELGRTEEAAREYREALRLRPDDAEIRARVDALSRSGPPPGN